MMFYRFFTFFHLMMKNKEDTWSIVRLENSKKIQSLSKPYFSELKLTSIIYRPKHRLQRNKYKYVARAFRIKVRSNIVRNVNRNGQFWKRKIRSALYITREPVVGIRCS